MLSGMLRVLVVGLVVLVAAMFMLPRARLATPEAATLLPEARPLPELTLTDDEGHELPTSALRGQFTLLFFGFTNCPDVCPLTLSMLAEARAKIAARAPTAVPRVLFVSVDPARDTPERINAYVHAFDESFVGATAPDPTLEPWFRALGVTVQRHENGGEHYTMTHTAAIFFVGPDAEWIAVASGPHDPAVVASDYLKIRQRYGATHPSS